MLLAGYLLLAGCPHDFNRVPQDAAASDMAFDVARPDLAPAEDTPVPDAWVQLDVVPTPDAGCPLPCVTTLQGSFKYPRGVAVGSGGEVYIAATGTHEIMIYTNGSASPFAGTGKSSCVDSVDSVDPLLAKFSEPSGLTLDSTGTIYVADHSCNKIRFISGGSVGTLAGMAGGGIAWQDGPAAQAHFYGPRGVAVDSSGTVYVADSGNNRIRTVANDVVGTLAGDGFGGFADGDVAVARFNSPTGVAVDSAGAVYVADSSNARIRMVKNGIVTTLAGGPEGYIDGPALNAQFNSPTDVAVDSAGTVYVADSGNNRIRVIKGGMVDTLAGDGAPALKDGAGATASFNYPYGLALDGSGTLLYVADYENDKIRVIQLK